MMIYTHSLRDPTPRANPSATSSLPHSKKKTTRTTPMPNFTRPSARTRPSPKSNNPAPRRPPLRNTPPRPRHPLRPRSRQAQTQQALHQAGELRALGRDGRPRAAIQQPHQARGDALVLCALGRAMRPRVPMWRRPRSRRTCGRDSTCLAASGGRRTFLSARGATM